MIDALRIVFDVACPVEHAFSTWTTRMSIWWPDDHTVFGEPGTAVVLEPVVGGRIYERTTDGVEHAGQAHAAHRLACDLVTWNPCCGCTVGPPIDGARHRPLCAAEA